MHYVEVRHTRDYKVFRQDYGGFKYLSAEQREKVIQLVFGPDGLKPGLVKAWSDPFHEPVNDNDDPYTMNPAGFDHQTTTRWLRYFAKRGLEETRKRGCDPPAYYGAEHNLWWPDHQVVDFLRYAREVLDRQGLKEVGLTNGETNSWGAFFSYKVKDGTVFEFARRLREDPVAVKNLALITSHGFRQSYDPRGIDLIRQVRPELHVWTTSYTWADMSLDVLEDTRQLIYTVKCNGLIPWATVHNDYESDKLSPPATVRVSSNPNYEPFQAFVYRNGTLEYTAPARSSVGFTAAR